MTNVIDRAARAMLAFQAWKLSSRRKPPGERKGERAPGYRGETADDVVRAFTDDVSEQCRLLHEAQERAREMAEITGTGKG